MSSISFKYLLNLKFVAKIDIVKVHDSKAYKGARHDMIEFLAKPKVVLDIGCNEGSTGELIKSKFGKQVQVDGIDYNQASIDIADKVLNKTKTINLNSIEDFKNFLGTKTYDHIIMGDVLEHLLFPKLIVHEAYQNLNPGGKIIISLPNTGYYKSLLNLLSHNWPRNERGVYDKTHLTLYFRNNINELSPDKAGFKVLKYKYRWRETKGTKLDFLLNIFNYIPYFRNYFTHQFLIEIDKPI